MYIINIQYQIKHNLFQSTTLADYFYPIWPTLSIPIKLERTIYLYENRKK